MTRQEAIKILAQKLAENIGSHDAYEIILEGIKNLDLIYSEHWILGIAANFKQRSKAYEIYAGTLQSALAKQQIVFLAEICSSVANCLDEVGC